MSETFVSPFKAILQAERTLPQYLIRKCQDNSENGKAEWVIDGNTNVRYYYENFEQQTRHIGSTFFKKGLRKLDIVLYMAKDPTVLNLFLMGVWRANGVVRLISSQVSEEELRETVKECRVGWIICDYSESEKCLSVTESIYWDVEVIVTGDADDCTSMHEYLNDDGSELPELELKDSDPAVIFNKINISGKYRGVVHTHRSVLHTVMTLGKVLQSYSGGNPILPVCQTTDFVGVLLPLTAFAEAKPIVTIADLNMELVTNTIHEFKVGCVWGSAAMVQMCLLRDFHDFPSVECIINFHGGHTSFRITTDSLSVYFPQLKRVINCFSTVESLLIAMTFCPDKQHALEDIPETAIGKLAPGVKMQLRKGNSKRFGEMFVKSPNTFDSYHEQQGMTKSVLLDGYWYKTGEMGYVDKKGYLFLQTVNDNHFNSEPKPNGIIPSKKAIDKVPIPSPDEAKNVNISTKEEEDDNEIERRPSNMSDVVEHVMSGHPDIDAIEEVIYKHPAVARCCVVLVDIPFNTETKLPRAFVIVKESQDCNPDELRMFANKQLPPERQLRGGLFILPELPQGKTNKIVRDILTMIRIPHRF